MLFTRSSSVKTYAVRAECGRSCQWQKPEGLFAILSKRLIISWQIISQSFDVLLISAFLSDFHRKMQNPLHASQSKMKLHLPLKLWAGAESRLRPDHSSRSLWPLGRCMRFPRGRSSASSQLWKRLPVCFCSEINCTEFLKKQKPMKYFDETNIPRVFVFAH